MVGWDSTGAIEFNGAVCSRNTAGSRGGCFYGTGKGVIANGTKMESNEAESGGAVCEYGLEPRHVQQRHFVSGYPYRTKNVVLMLRTYKKRDKAARLEILVR